MIEVKNLQKTYVNTPVNIGIRSSSECKVIDRFYLFIRNDITYKNIF